MTTNELYVKGARVWFPHAERVWELAILLEDYEPSRKSLRLQLEESKQERSVDIAKDEDLPPLRNPDILLGENNLTSLSFLHEPAVLNNLHVRFQRRCIYTYCGIVLVAFNPYSELPIYGNDTIWAYRGQAMGDLEPHIFAVAEEAYTKLERESKDQSIIVSGESGAGKTVSAKYAMRYFATIGGSSKETQVEKKVLASSPIMEAIGNAKTTRNDNSSRFGKYIEIQFNKAYNIVGASMRTYLLEKSRVVFQAPGERNYHIFYQICAAARRLPHLQLLELGAEQQFHYLAQGGSPRIDGVDDLRCFDETISSLTVLGFSSKQQDDALRILAAVLHLGNVRIERADAESCHISSADRHLLVLQELLGLEAAPMRKWLCNRRIVSMRDVIVKPMSAQEARRARDALAKHVYARLFNWMVERVNASLESPSRGSQCFIGVLDIYGFETFELNSFEQFCINYANEKLQQQFNQHVFKLEQEEYLKEEIEWTFIDFYDNQPCIDLIETKLGILDLLDEECRMPKGSDASWAEKLYAKCGKHKHFAKPRFGTSAFLVDHFADRVQYETSGFLEKNRDTVVEEQIDVLRNADNSLLKKLFSPEDEGKEQLAAPQPTKRVKVSPHAKPVANKVTSSASAAKNRKTVGSQFRDSLNMLMGTLNATTPHYVRCIKPNDTKQAFEYNPQRAVQQLRACGVLETIRISAAGFPSQRTYGDFFQRYRCLCHFKDIKRDDLRETCRRILARYIKDRDKFKFGKTKVLFRAGQVAYLEKLRADKQRDACLMIQKTVRGWVARKRYRQLRRSILGLQRYGRGFLARRKARAIRRHRAATRIQAWYRGCAQRRKYLGVRRTALGLQTRARGLLARRRFRHMQDVAAATKIQRYARGYLARLACKRKLAKIVLVQACVRKFLAKRLFRRLKTEARSVEHVKSLNKGLEMKIINLQHKINELTKENQHHKALHLEVGEMKAKLEGHKALETENKKLNAILIERDKAVAALQASLDEARQETLRVSRKHEAVVADRDELVQKLQRENELLRVELSQSQTDRAKVVRQDTDDDERKLAMSRLAREKDLLLFEQDEDKTAYQRLLKNYHDLEQRNEILEQKLAVYAPGHSRTLSNASSGSGPNPMIELPQDDHNIDFGYGSVRSRTSSSAPYSRLETIDWNQQSQQTSLQRRSESPPDGVKSPSNGEVPNNTNHAPVDVGLVLKLQQKLKDVEKEKGRLIRMVEGFERVDDLLDEQSTAQDTFRLKELKVENAQLKRDLGMLRKNVAEADSTTSVPKTLIEQFTALQEELECRREECIKLRSKLAENTQRMAEGDSIIDAELELAYDAQKKINRQLESELQAKELEWKQQREDWRAEIDQLYEKVERQEKLVSINLSKAPQTPTEEFLQYEITRLTAENLELQEKYDEIATEARKMKKEIKQLQKRLKEGGLEVFADEYKTKARPRAKHRHKADVAESSSNDANNGIVSSSSSTRRGSSSNADSVLPAGMIRKKERDFEGMFEFRKEDVSLIARHLIAELNPRTAITLLPGLPAYVLFMCVRHTDQVNDGDKLRALLTAYLDTVKRVVKKHSDFEVSVLWLSNTLRLLHNMKQYSGDKPFQLENSPRQNEQCLRNFELGDFRVELSNVAFWIFNNVVDHLKERVQPMTVPALLEHEAIAGLDASRPRSSSTTGQDAEALKQRLNRLIDELTRILKQLEFHGIDPEISVQIFKQLFYFMCASALNNLLLRHELCHWTKGMQIRYNLSHLEQWARDYRLVPATDALQPIVQAAQLLQARKRDEDVDAVCDMCSCLSANQIVKILNLYTPADEFETRVPQSFINRVQIKLQERKEHSDQLLMDLKFAYPIRFPYHPSNIRLEDIEIPEVLNLPMLKKI
uniref:Unconventional myosin-Va n=1 Tax=Trichogramma kaykai TaxID=54128 RepID=A0ABD2WEW9_9HYME